MNVLNTTINLKPSVLLVNDDEITSAILQSLLQHEGYEVTRAVDANQAYDTINNSKQSYSLALIDLLKSYKSSFDLMSHIRTLRDWDKTPVILISSRNEEDDIFKALGAGAADYIVKPFSLGEVLSRIRTSAPQEF